MAKMIATYKCAMLMTYDVVRVCRTALNPQTLLIEICRAGSCVQALVKKDELDALINALES